MYFLCIVLRFTNCIYIYTCNVFMGLCLLLRSTISVNKEVLWKHYTLNICTLLNDIFYHQLLNTNTSSKYEQQRLYVYFAETQSRFPIPRLPFEMHQWSSKENVQHCNKQDYFYKNLKQFHYEISPQSGQRRFIVQSMCKK